MKVKDYLRQPNIEWVNHYPGDEKNKECLTTAIWHCYSWEEQPLIFEFIHDVIKTGTTSHWNDTHTKEEVLALVDRLDI